MSRDFSCTRPSHKGDVFGSRLHNFFFNEAVVNTSQLLVPAVSTDSLLEAALKGTITTCILRDLLSLAEE